jgi:hypothetical protein
MLCQPKAQVWQASSWVVFLSVGRRRNICIVIPRSTSRNDLTLFLTLRQHMEWVALISTTCPFLHISRHIMTTKARSGIWENAYWCGSTYVTFISQYPRQKREARKRQGTQVKCSLPRQHETLRTHARDYNDKPVFCAAAEQNDVEGDEATH